MLYSGSTVTYSCESPLQAKVVDPNTGQMVPLGTPGELMIRGSCVMHEYWEDPEKTSQAIAPDRWYKTGYVKRVLLYPLSTTKTVPSKCLSTATDYPCIHKLCHSLSMRQGD